MKRIVVRVTNEYELEVTPELIDAYKEKYAFSNEADEATTAQELAFWYFADEGLHLRRKPLSMLWSAGPAPSEDDVEVTEIED